MLRGSLVCVVVGKTDISFPLFGGGMGDVEEFSVLNKFALHLLQTESIGFLNGSLFLVGDLLNLGSWKGKKKFNFFAIGELPQ